MKKAAVRGAAGIPARRDGASTWLLSGVPRSGTSLCCRLAGNLPDTVALSEPIRRKAFGGMETPSGACARIGEFATQARARILSERRAPSLQVEGRLDDNRGVPRVTEGGLRRLRGEWGEIAIDKPLSPRFTLLVKHNALFAALLPRLADSFPFLALVRNPLSVLASWQTVALPVNRGRLPAGEELDPALRRVLEREPELLRRQVIILDWFFVRYRAHLPPSDIIRYEDVVESGGLDLFRRLGHEDTPPAHPRERQRGCPLRCGGRRCLLAGAARAARRLDALLPALGLRGAGGAHAAETMSATFRRLGSASTRTVPRSGRRSARVT